MSQTPHRVKKAENNLKKIIMTMRENGLVFNGIYVA